MVGSKAYDTLPCIARDTDATGRAIPSTEGPRLRVVDGVVGQRICRKCAVALLFAVQLCVIHLGTCRTVDVSTCEQFLESWQDQSVTVIHLLEDVQLRSRELPTFVLERNLTVKGLARAQGLTGLIAESSVCGLHLGPNATLKLQHLRLGLPALQGATLIDHMLCESVEVKLVLAESHIVSTALRSLIWMPRPSSRQGRQVLYSGPCWDQIWQDLPKPRHQGLYMVECAFEVEEAATSTVSSALLKRTEVISDSWFHCLHLLDVDSATETLSIRPCPGMHGYSLSVGRGIGGHSSAPWLTPPALVVICALCTLCLLVGLLFLRPIWLRVASSSRHVHAPLGGDSSVLGLRISRVARTVVERCAPLAPGKLVIMSDWAATRNHHLHHGGTPLLAVGCINTSAVPPDLLATVLSLRHPNVTPTLRVMAPGSATNVKPGAAAAARTAPVCIVKELYDVGTLACALQDWQLETAPASPPPLATLDMRFILLRAQEVACGLVYLHGRGILHGDARAENVRLCSCSSDPYGCTAKLGNFELSRLLRPGQALATGAMPPPDWANVVAKGIVTHAAPEVLCKGWTSADKAADVYAFGVLLYELVRGYAPYQGLTRQEIAAGVVNEGLRPILPAHVPQAYCRLAQSCWQERPAQRPSMEEVQHRLSHMLAHVAELQHAVDDSLASVRASMRVW